MRKVLKITGRGDARISPAAAPKAPGASETDGGRSRAGTLGHWRDSRESYYGEAGFEALAGIMGASSIPLAVKS